MESTDDKLKISDKGYILEITKTDHNYFLFFLNNASKSDTTSFMNEFLYLPKIPLLGKYNKNTYEMCDVLSLVTIDLKEGNFLNLPSELTNYLKFSFNQKLENNTKSPEKNLSQFIDSQFEFSEIKFYWVCTENTLIKDDSKIYNIVPHTFLFDEFDFSKNRRIFINYPIFLYIADEMKKKNINNPSYIKEFNQENNKYNYNNNNFKTGINLNKLRLEYSSIHLIKDSIGFSPNNLKFYMEDVNSQIFDFYLIIVKDKIFHIFYYWIINEKYQADSIRKILTSSRDLKELLKELENIMNENEAMKNLNQIFYNNINLI